MEYTKRPGLVQVSIDKLTLQELQELREFLRTQRILCIQSFGSTDKDGLECFVALFTNGSINKIDKWLGEHGAQEKGP